MLGPLDTSTLSAPAQKILQAPPKMQEMAARGIVPGIPPGQLILVLVAFLASDNPTVAETAQKTLDNLPEPVITGALASDLPAHAIHHLAIRHHARTELLSTLLNMPRLDVETVEDVARVCSELGAELLATNEERLLKNPKIIELLYLNKNCRMSTADRMIELAVRNNVEVALPAWKEMAHAIQNELVLESDGQATPDDLLFQESIAVAEQLKQVGALEDAIDEDQETNEARVKEKYLPLHARIAQMTNSQKIRMTAVGTAEALLILIGDPSPLVALAAAKSAQMNEHVVEKVVKRRNVSGEVISAIGQKPEFLKALGTKRDLMKNPKTPPSLAMRLITHFQEHELRRLGEDRNVSGSIRQLIKNHLEKKKR